jgi:hypothetical protein
MGTPDKVDLERAAWYAERLRRERLVASFVIRWSCTREVACRYLIDTNWDYDLASTSYFFNERVVVHDT